jgi:hypothetical protein
MHGCWCCVSLSRWPAGSDRHFVTNGVKAGPQKIRSKRDPYPVDPRLEPHLSYFLSRTHMGAATQPQEYASCRHRSKIVGVEHAAAPLRLIHLHFPLFSKSSLPLEKANSPAAETWWIFGAALEAGWRPSSRTTPSPITLSSSRSSPLLTHLKSLKPFWLHRNYAIVYCSHCLFNAAWLLSLESQALRIS